MQCRKAASGIIEMP